MTNSKLLAAVLSSATAGALLGVLLAPQAGAELRKMLRESFWSKAKNKASDLAEGAENAFDSAVRNGKKSAYNIREAVS